MDELNSFIQDQVILDPNFAIELKVAEKVAVNREIVHLRTKLEVRTIALRASMSVNTAFLVALILRFLLR